jgi:hypothetical protein
MSLFTQPAAVGSAETKPTPVTEGTTPLNMEEMFREDQGLDSFLQVVLRSRDEVDDLEAQLADAKRSKANAEADLVSKMAEMGLDSFRMSNLTISRTEESYPRVNKADEAQQLEWLREIGAGGLIKESVNHMTFAAFIRKDWKGELPEFVKVFKEWRLSIRKGVVK